MSSPISFAAFSHLARGGQSEVVKHGILPDTKSPGVSVTALFPFQSYFDDTLLQKAIAIQSANEPIVALTLKKEEIGGYAVGLHPSSQTPIAFQPMVGNSAAGSQAVILRPGQIYRPHGKPDGRPGNFSAFSWGLPFGWLGGGVATLYVFPSADADVAWPGDAEVIFQRQRMKILAPADLPTAANKNWPMRFPWTLASRGSTSISQAGQAAISISQPTRVLMSLRLTSMATADTMRILFHETNDMDLDSAGAVIAAQARFVDYVWGTYSAAGGANLNTQYPVVEFTGPVARLAADLGGVQLIDMSAGTLTNAFVDVVRYGKI